MIKIGLLHLLLSAESARTLVISLGFNGSPRRYVFSTSIWYSSKPIIDCVDAYLGFVGRCVLALDVGGSWPGTAFDRIALSDGHKSVHNVYESTFTNVVYTLGIIQN